MNESVELNNSKTVICHQENYLPFLQEYGSQFAPYKKKNALVNNYYDIKYINMTYKIEIEILSHEIVITISRNYEKKS